MISEKKPWDQTDQMHQIWTKLGVWFQGGPPQVCSKRSEIIPINGRKYMG